MGFVELVLEGGVGEGSLVIYDLWGRRVYGSTGGVLEQRVSVAGLAAGIYFLEVVFEGRRGVTRFLKL